MQRVWRLGRAQVQEMVGDVRHQKALPPRGAKQL